MPDDPRDLATLLGAYRIALLTTRGAEGHLRCRPMAMRQKVRGEEIWFATELASTKCRDLEADPRCALALFDAKDGTTLSISGRGEVLRDRNLALALWDPSWTRWFPGGPAQRGLALLRVIPELVERHGPTGDVEVMRPGPAAPPARPRRKAAARARPRRRA
ncbi:MAG TPA: pyridoxamine 5'-phosphate oxidase family protein [Anaeromyxobacter sp.]